MMRAHSGRGFVWVTEDEKKVTFELNPCGSGGRMIQAGLYGPQNNLFKVKGPLLLTHGFEKEWPVYCSHCAFLHLVAPIDWGGTPFPVIEAAKNPDKEPCYAHFYKDSKDVPEEYYKRVGKGKK
jgi:hypothetical protein